MAARRRSSKVPSNKKQKHRRETRPLRNGAWTLSAVAGGSILAVLIAYLEIPNILNRQTDGGYRLADTETLAKFGSEICTIEKKYADEITEEMFEEIYRHKKPLILLFKNGARDWTDPEKWQLKKLKEEHGRWSVRSGSSVEIVRHGGVGDVATSFKEYLDKLFQKDSPVGDPFYMFDRGFFKQSSLPDTLRPPPYLKITAEKDASIFLLGTSRSGVSFHNHGDGWNGVVYGLKRWFIYPREQSPPGGIYPGFTQTEWYEKVYPNLTDAQKPIECVQQAGELLYIPEGAYHSTLNIGDTIAVAIQTKNYTMDTVKLHYDELRTVGKLHGEKSPEKRQILIEESRRLLGALREILPENAELINRLGESYQNSKEFETAIKHFDHAIELDPFFVNAYINKGETYAKMGEKDLAEYNLKYAVELSPKLWDSYASYGDFLIHNSRTREAAELYKKGTELEPALASFWKALRNAQRKLGDNEGADRSQEKVDWLKRVGKAGLHLATNKGR